MALILCGENLGPPGKKGEDAGAQRGRERRLSPPSAAAQTPPRGRLAHRPKSESQRSSESLSGETLKETLPGGSFPAGPLLPSPSSPSHPRPPEAAAVGIPITASICQPFIPQTKEQLLINRLQRKWGGGATVALLGHGPSGNANTDRKQPRLAAHLPVAEGLKEQALASALGVGGPLRAVSGWKENGRGSPLLLEQAYPPFPVKPPPQGPLGGAASVPGKAGKPALAHDWCIQTGGLKTAFSKGSWTVFEKGEQNVL